MGRYDDNFEDGAILCNGVPLTREHLMSKRAMDVKPGDWWVNLADMRGPVCRVYGNTYPDESWVQFGEDVKAVLQLDDAGGGWVLDPDEPVLLVCREAIAAYGK